MKSILTILFSFILVGCAVEEELPANENTNETPPSEEPTETQVMTNNFRLSASDGYVAQDDYETPHTYVVEPNNNKVYVDIHEEGMSDEEREAFMDMSEEEIEEYFDNQPIYEEPIYDITLLEADDESILLEYEDESVLFTALSATTYEVEDGTRYILEDYGSIDEYMESFGSSYVIEENH